MPHVTRDGVKLYYDEAGSGDRAIVFVHGWCCDRSHHAPQVAHYAASRRCISLDLRGHGDSDKPAGDYAVPAHADDVAFVCGELGLRKPLIVGHSMGGAIALSLAARYPEIPSAIVMLDGAIMFPDAVRAVAAALDPAFHSDAYLEPLAMYFNSMWIASDDEKVRAQVVEAALNTARHVAVGEWEGITAYDAAADAAKCSVPAMYVGSHAPIADIAAIRAALPAAIVAQTAGAGHFHQLLVPDQVNAMIDRFLLINSL